MYEYALSLFLNELSVTTFQGKKVTSKKADIKSGKIYVGKLPDDGITEDDIRTFFSDHGVVTEVGKY